MNATAKEHDYTRGTWGHDCTFTPADHGQRGRMSGWGHGISAGDYIVLVHPAGGTTRYVVDTVEYYRNPPDMWRASVTFAPRVAGG